MKSLPGFGILVFAVAAGCGSIPESTSDGGGGNPDGAGGGDGPGPMVDAPPMVGPVTVNVWDNGTPVAGVAVAYQSAAGELIHEATTDANGSVTRDVPAGSMVTVLVPFTENGSTSYQMQTIAGVMPNDRIPFGSAAPSEPSNFIQQTTYSWPSTSVADVYFITNGCGSTTEPQSRTSTVLPVSSGCLNSAGRYATLGLALDTNGFIKLYASATSIAATANPVNLSPWGSSFSVYSLGLTNAPFALDVKASTGVLRDGVPFDLPPEYRAAVSPSQNAGLDLFYPGGFGFQHEYRLTFDYPAGGTGQISRRFYPTEPPETVDLQATLLPEIRYALLSPSDPTRPVAEWDLAGAPGAADGAVVVLSWTVLPAQELRTWWVLLPPGAPESFRFPVLAQAHAWYGPTPADSLNPPSVVYFGMDRIADYHDLRNAWGLSLFAKEPEAFDQFRAVLSGFNFN